MIDLTWLKEFVLLLKDLPRTKGGVFVIGLLIVLVPAYINHNNQSTSHERELNRYVKTEELLNKRLDSCDAKAQRMYIKGIEENINKELLPAKIYKEVVTDMKNEMEEDEKRILNRIEKKKEAIQKEMEVKL